MRNTDSPLRFWDWCAERRAKINNLTAKNLFQLNGSNAKQKITGDPGDISNLCQFGWFAWCRYRDHAEFPGQAEKLGRCLGPADNYSNEMCQWILKDTMEFTTSHNIRALTNDEMRSIEGQREREVFMTRCRARHGDKILVPGKKGKMIRPEQKERESDEDDMEEDPLLEDLPPFEPLVPNAEPSNIPEADVVDDDGNPISNLDHLHDTFVNMEVRLPKGERELYGKIIGLCLDQNGKVIETPHTNPVRNTLMYQIKFDDGTSSAYAANTIAENMWRLVDNEGYHRDSLHSILEYKFAKNAVRDGLIYDRKGKQ